MSEESEPGLMFGVYLLGYCEKCQITLMLYDNQKMQDQVVVL